MEENKVLEKVPEDGKDVIIVHHNDMDGYVAALWAKKYFERLTWTDDEPMSKINKIELQIASYSGANRLHERLLEKCKNNKNMIIAILDFSFKPEQLEELAQEIGYQNIVWIDHHVGIINKYREWDNHAMIPGFRITTGLSGAELTYLFFENEAPIDSPHFFTQPSFAKDEITISGAKFSKTYNMADHEQRDHFLKRFLPAGLKISGDWDVWRHAENPDVRDAIWLNDWFKVHEKDFFQDPEIDSMLYKIFFCDDYEMSNDEYLGAEEANDLTGALLEGSIIDNYITASDEALVRHNAFKCVIKGFEDINAVAVNAPRFSSTVFDIIKDRYEVGVVYIYDGKNDKNVFSFYRLGQNPEKTISCFKIAEAFGGGGHASAAGCTVDKELEVIRVKTSR